MEYLDSGHIMFMSDPGCINAEPKQERIEYWFISSAVPRPSSNNPGRYEYSGFNSVMKERDLFIELR